MALWKITVAVAFIATGWILGWTTTRAQSADRHHAHVAIGVIASSR